MTRHHTTVNGSQYQGEAGYASPYCPGESNTSDPWFVQNNRIMDVALVLAAAAAVSLAFMAIVIWGWA